MQVGGIFRVFWRNRRGAITIIGAVAVPAMLAMAGLVAEYGNALVVRTNNQRIADAAAYAGAIAYNQAGSDTAGQSAMKAVATSVAGFNGVVIGPSATTLVTSSPSGSGNPAVLVKLSTSVPLLLSRLIGPASGPTMQAIPVQAYAEIVNSGVPCVIALNTTVTYGVTMTGGTHLNAPTCTVAAKTSESLDSGPTLAAKAISYGTTAPSVTNGSTLSGSVYKSGVTDPVAGTAELAALTARVATVKALGTPAGPAKPVLTSFSGGANPNFGYVLVSQVQSTMPPGCTASGSDYGANWTVACTGTTINIASFTVAGGMTVNFNTGSAPTTVYKFSGPFASAGSQINFGPGVYNFNNDVTLSTPVTFGSTSSFNVNGNLLISTPMTFSAGNYTVTGNLTITQSASFGNGNFNIGGDLIQTNGPSSFGSGTVNVAGGISNTGGTAMTFGSGTFRIGQLATSCNGNGAPSICAPSSGLTSFGNGGTTPSIITLTSGVYAGGGATVKLGSASGTGNSFKSGSSTGNYSISVQGGAVMLLADMTGGIFEVNGAVLDDGGGSCLVIGKAANHDISQYVAGAGAIVLGPGTYTIGQYMWMGASGGGNSNNCPGQSSSVGVLAQAATIYIDGTNVSGSGVCAGYSFCVGAGYSSVVVTAPPTTSSSSRLAIASSPASNGGSVANPTFPTNGVYLFAGAGLQVSGTLYYPHGPIRLEGGASLGEAGMGCLTIIGDTVTLKNGTTVASSCLTGSANSAVLVK